MKRRTRSAKSEGKIDAEAEGESRKMEVRARGGRGMGAACMKERKTEREKKREGCGVSRRVTREKQQLAAAARKRGKEGVKAALQYPTLANRSAIHWSVRVIPGSFGK